MDANHFQRRDGIWKIADRVAVIDKPFGLTERSHDPCTLHGDTSHGSLVHASRDRSDLGYTRPVAPPPKGIITAVRPSPRP